MKQSWSKAELTEHWSVLPDERKLLHDKMAKHRLIFTCLLKFFQYTGRFPENLAELPKVVVNYLAAHLNLHTEVIGSYNLDGRIARAHKLIIRGFLNFRSTNSSDTEQIEALLISSILPQENDLPIYQK